MTGGDWDYWGPGGAVRGAWWLDGRPELDWKRPSTIGVWYTVPSRQLEVGFITSPLNLLSTISGFDGIDPVRRRAESIVLLFS